MGNPQFYTTLECLRANLKFFNVAVSDLKTHSFLNAENFQLVLFALKKNHQGVRLTPRYFRLSKLVKSL